LRSRSERLWAGAASYVKMASRYGGGSPARSAGRGLPPADFRTFKGVMEFDMTPILAKTGLSCKPKFAGARAGSRGQPQRRWRGLPTEAW
jgi:hypothetical protein